MKMGPGYNSAGNHINNIRLLEKTGDIHLREKTGPPKGQLELTDSSFEATRGLDGTSLTV